MERRVLDGLPHSDRVWNHRRQLLAVGSVDISQALLDDEPRLVHFAGHGGGPAGSIAAEGDYGLARVIPVDGLVDLFRTFGQSVDCMLVNACDTEAMRPRRPGRP